MSTQTKSNRKSVRAKVAHRQANEARVERRRALFDALKEDGEEHVLTSRLRAELSRAGLRAGDPRLAECLAALAEREAAGDELLDAAAFEAVVHENVLLVERALQGRLVVPDFEAFADRLGELHQRVTPSRGGKVADYIPQLSRVDPEQFGVSVTTVDGQRASLGDAREEFCVQSTCKPIGYCLALEEHGAQKVHTHIGCEPSGHSFNELTLDRRGRPHNPMINAGAIMSSALIRPKQPMADRFDHVMRTWRSLAGGAKPGFSNATYLSERLTADRNFALGYFMREQGTFPAGTDLVATLEFYFQCCSVELDAERMSHVAATLANGGVSPTTGERVFGPETVQKCLSMMDSCGMYDFSGEWAFQIGLPAKSGVSGAIMVVVPGVLGLCVWSPRLDELGNSVRGIDFCRELVSRFNFHNYDSLCPNSDKIDPRRPAGARRHDLLGELCWAASEGDLGGVRRLVASGASLSTADYDGRTPLHLAASEGHLNLVRFLAERGVDLAPRDRWGNTPLDDARREGHTAVAALLAG